MALAFAIALGTTTGWAAAGPVVLASEATETTSTRRGVVVLAAAGTSEDLAWPVARAVYEDEALRPKVGDAEARVLAGERPKDGAPAPLRELAELRAQVKGDDAASRAILAEIARRTGARAIAVVGVAEGSAEVRLWDAADGQVGGTRYRREASGWTPFVGSLRTRYAPPKELPKEAPPKETTKKGGAFYENPWFWVAVGGAAAAGVAVYAATRNDTSPAPVILQWR